MSMISFHCAFKTKWEMTNDGIYRTDFCHRNITSKNKVTNYFMPAAIENNGKETRDRKILIIENRSQKKKMQIWSQKYISPFILQQNFVFQRQNLEKDDTHVKHNGSNSFCGCIMMKGKGALITFHAQLGSLCFIAFPVLTFSFNYCYSYCCDFF